MGMARCHVQVRQLWSAPPGRVRKVARSFRMNLCRPQTSVYHDKNRIPNDLAPHHHLQRLPCRLLRRYSNCFGSVPWLFQKERSEYLTFSPRSNYSYPSRETIFALHFYCSPVLLFLVLASYNGSIFSRISKPRIQFAQKAISAIEPFHFSLSYRGSCLRMHLPLFVLSLARAMIV